MNDGEDIPRLNEDADATPYNEQGMDLKEGETTTPAIDEGLELQYTQQLIPYTKNAQLNFPTRHGYGRYTDHRHLESMRSVHEPSVGVVYNFNVTRDLAKNGVEAEYMEEITRLGWSTVISPVYIRT
jgi:hypothetical protein